MNKHHLKLVEATTQEDFEKRVNLILDEIYEEGVTRSVIPDRALYEFHIILDRINTTLGTKLGRNYIEREFWPISDRITKLWWRIAIKIKLNSLEGSKNLDGKRMRMKDINVAILPNGWKRTKTPFYDLLCSDRELLLQFHRIRAKQWVGDDEINKKGHQILDDLEQKVKGSLQAVYEVYTSTVASPSRRLKHVIDVFEEIEKDYGKGKVTLAEIRRRLTKMYSERVGEVENYEVPDIDGNLKTKHFTYVKVTSIVWQQIMRLQVFHHFFVWDKETDIVVFNKDYWDNNHLITAGNLAKLLGLNRVQFLHQYPELALRVATQEEKELFERLPTIFEKLLEWHKKTNLVKNTGWGHERIMSFNEFTKNIHEYIDQHPIVFYTQLPLAFFSNPKVVEAYVDCAMGVAAYGDEQQRKALISAVEDLKRSGNYFTMKDVQRKSSIDHTVIRVRHPEIYKQIKLEMGVSKDDPYAPWYFDQMGYTHGVSRSNDDVLHWKGIKQSWLLEAGQKYVKHMMRKNRAISTLINYVRKLNHFSIFLEKHDIKKAEDIDRELIEEYLLEVSTYKSQGGIVGTLKAVFEFSKSRNILNLKGNLIWDDDASFTTKDFTHVRFIPDSVMDQLVEGIPKIGNDMFERFWSIMLDTGKRIGEIVHCAFDCLEEVDIQDESGNWVKAYNFRIWMPKLRRYNTTPIDENIAQLIKLQQEFVRKEFPQGSKLLFPQTLLNSDGRRNVRVGGPINTNILKNALDKVIEENNITDPNGLPFKLRSHDIRHTFANTCLRGQMSLVTVQKLLGHVSPEMTLWYAKMSDDQNRDEWQKHYQSRLVSITGESVATNWLDTISEEDRDIEWMRHNLKAQALPNGLCTLPKKLGDCPHANACLTCTHFRTDYTFLDIHKEQLARTNKMISAAKQNGWERQVEMNTKVKTSLTNIINGIEKGSNDNVSA